MKVLKFGGTSVGSVAGLKNVRSIISRQQEPKILVLSAMSGVTNQLVRITDVLAEKSSEDILEIVSELRERHFSTISELIENESLATQAREFVEEKLNWLEQVSEKEFNPELEAGILTRGEFMLTKIFSLYLKSEGVDNSWLDATQFMQVFNLENPDTDHVGDLFNESIRRAGYGDLFITQGFVRVDKSSKISTLKRGGSDYTATILGAAIGATSVEIWTDINGLHNNDPRFVENTYPVSQLSFEEAAELAYFGAKILHPQTISPIMGMNIPVFLKNTFTPKKQGTKICSLPDRPGLKAISAKDDITAIKIKSNRMLMAHGFLRKIFEVFDHYETPIDMITTSEIAISLTIDDTRNLHLIERELAQYGEISVDHQHSIICIVGEGLIEQENTSHLFEILKDVPVRMISYGGSNNNVSLLVDTQHKIETLKKLNDKLFAGRKLSSV